MTSVWVHSTQTLLELHSTYQFSEWDVHEGVIVPVDEAQPDVDWQHLVDDVSLEVAKAASSAQHQLDVL